MDIRSPLLTRMPADTGFVWKNDIAPTVTDLRTSGRPWLIIRSAMERKESRGLHFSLDHPDTANIARDTILVPTNFAAQDIFVTGDQ